MLAVRPQSHVVVVDGDATGDDVYAASVHAPCFLTGQTAAALVAGAVMDSARKCADTVHASGVLLLGCVLFYVLAFLPHLTASGLLRVARVRTRDSNV